VSLELLSRYDSAPSGLIEMECRRDDCDGRMLVDDELARRLGTECPIPECDSEVKTA